MKKLSCQMWEVKLVGSVQQLVCRNRFCDRVLLSSTSTGTIVATSEQLINPLPRVSAVTGYIRRRLDTRPCNTTELAESN